MDQHPIPQDVTGFQFKLIGTMTVKQFGFVACGVIAAVVLYYLPLPSLFGILIKVILIPLLGGSGVIIAFVPIDGRPIDTMAMNLTKALFSPNQYIYHRTGKILAFTKINAAAPQPQKKDDEKEEKKATTHAGQLNQKEAKLRALLTTSQSGKQNDLDKKEAAFLQSLTKTEETETFKPAQTTPVSLPVQNQAQQPNRQQQQLVTQETQLEQALAQAKQEEATNQTSPIHDIAHQKVEQLTKQIEDIHTKKQQLEKELTQLKTQLTNQSKTTVEPLPLAQDPHHVRTIPQNETQRIGLPRVSDTPNVIVGIVKDSRGNVLSNVLVEIKDPSGNPVRAFKTNPLGQFASATPLAPGTYTMELEDTKKLHRFDIISIIVNNQVMSPIEIISHDAREDLRKELFN
jgi:hypothetical protein